MLEHRDDGANQAHGLRLHQWMSLKSHLEIEHFCIENALIRVDATPQDAALTPSWPQFLARSGLYSFLVIFLMVFVWNGSSKMHPEQKPSSGPNVTPNQQDSSRKVKNFLLNPIAKKDTELQFPDDHITTSRERYPSMDLNNVLVLPVLVLFPFWLAAFIMSEMEGNNGGWVSVLYWAEWIPLTRVSSFFWIPLALHWSASLAMLIQRWTGSIGSVAYEITDLHGCIPHEGLDYLQEGRYSQGFRIFQTVGFVTLTLWVAYIGRRIFEGKRFSLFTNNPMGLIFFALIVYIGVIADRGMPVVVSGNCLLVEESARVGFVKADIRIAWKVLSFFIPVY